MNACGWARAGPGRCTPEFKPERMNTKMGNKKKPVSKKKLTVGTPTVSKPQLNSLDKLQQLATEVADYYAGDPLRATVAFTSLDSGHWHLGCYRYVKSEYRNPKRVEIVTLIDPNFDNGVDKLIHTWKYQTS